MIKDVFGKSTRSSKQSQTYTDVRFFPTRACVTSFRVGFQRGAVAPQPGRRRGNSASDRLIGLDPDRLTRRALPVRGPELTPRSRFNSRWLRADRLKKQQIRSLKVLVAAAAVHYLAVAAHPCVTVMRTLTYAHPGGEGNKDRPIRFLR